MESIKNTLKLNRKIKISEEESIKWTRFNLIYYVFKKKKFKKVLKKPMVQLCYAQRFSVSK